MPEPRVYNMSARPRMLIRGFDADEQLAERIGALAPTVQRIGSLSEVSQDEWDVLVTSSQVDEQSMAPFRSGALAAAPHLRVVFLAPSDGFLKVESLGSTVGDVWLKSGHVRRELRRVEGLPASAQPLVDALEPTLRAREQHHYFELDRYTPRASTVPSASRTPRQSATFRPQIVAFAETADGKVLAGRYTRSAQAEGWLVPVDVADPAQWVGAALAWWHTADSERFPGSPDWTRQPAWATAQELKLLDQIESISVEREQALRELACREAAARDALTTARADADGFERGLLTQQDDALVASVQRAFEELGFIVVNADKDAEVRERLEDLRVSDPDAPNWIALVEVKGYGKGAKTSDLGQIERFARRYLQRTAQDPSNLWYVVNQFRDRDPASRQPVLQTNDDDVRVFVQSGGAVIDTVRIFELLRMAQTGQIEVAAARQLLRSATGRFEIATPGDSPERRSRSNQGS